MRHWVAMFCLVSVTLFLGACTAAPPTDAVVRPDPVATAAAEATDIVQRAQATALVLRAQAVATAMVEQASEIATAPSPTAGPVSAVQVQPAGSTPAASGTPVDLTATHEAEDSEEDAGTVEVVRVGLAGDGGLIEIKFRAPPKVAERWWQGSVSVTDEAIGTVYNEIPVVPKIGPLIGRPKREGQLGYVMLVNASPALSPGAVVTIALGEYKFEHVRLQ